MDDIKERLDRELKMTVSRLRQLSRSVATKERPGTVGGYCPLADEVDGIQVNESQEIGLATCEILAERVNRLSAALDRMSHGAYGTCLECGDPISLIRLRAMPEVRTCIRCQDRLERRGRPLDQPRRSLFGVDQDGALSPGSFASVRVLYHPNEEDRQTR
jgi:RNA polymerase-binding transcription factor DksA